MSRSAPTRLPRAALRALHARLAAEDGFTIIEVLASALLVALTAIGVFGAFDSATKASGTNKSRSIAASVAQSDQERLRALRPSELSNVRQTTTQEVDGKTFTISSRTDWLTDKTGAASCSSDDASADYLKLTSTVTWPDRGPLAPVTTDSLKAVPNGSYGPGEGSIAVEIVDRNGSGVANVPISITGPRSFSETTNALGCVLIGYVPVGSYTVSFSQAGYVQDLLPNAQSISKPVSVAGEQVSTVSLGYDQGGAVSARFRTRTIGASADSNTTGDAFTVANTGLGFPNQRSFIRTAGLANAWTSPLVFFPFAYNIWSGSCQEAEPTQYGAPVATATVPPGGTSPQTFVFEPSLRLNVKRYTNSGQTATGNASDARVVMTPTVTGCTTAIADQDTNGSGRVNYTLPYGDYNVCVEHTVAPSRTARWAGTVASRTYPNSDLTLPTLPYASTPTPASC